MKSQKGQSLVETALILPIILMILFGITDFGRIFHAYLTLDHAGREAARVATVGSDLGTIQTTISNATDTLESDDPSNPKMVGKTVYFGSTVVTDASATPTSGEEVKIELTYEVDFLTPIIGQIIGEFDLKDTTVMRVE
ncbi:TadE/TadG family type IV pilus assembly protein [Ferdinandcohnia sp. SAFN-114]|uniref:TadE/TadG family type IV pilus assembly protein n=1 Tax=Ferdinandcohnia sp. SAFN-114 TaxID=3387275 RepID=UPI003F7EEA6F